MDEVVRKLASLGLPGVLLAVIVATTGEVERHIAIPIALATIGGPFGIVGGLAVLGIVTLVAESLAGYGIEALLNAVYTERSKNESIHGILKEIRELPVSDELKYKLENNISKKGTSEKELALVGPQEKKID